MVRDGPTARFHQATVRSVFTTNTQLHHVCRFARISHRCFCRFCFVGEHEDRMLHIEHPTAEDKTSHDGFALHTARKRSNNARWPQFPPTQIGSQSSRAVLPTQIRKLPLHKHLFWGRQIKYRASTRRMATHFGTGNNPLKSPVVATIL